MRTIPPKKVSWLIYKWTYVTVKMHNPFRMATDYTHKASFKCSVNNIGRVPECCSLYFTTECDLLSWLEINLKCRDKELKTLSRAHSHYVTHTRRKTKKNCRIFLQEGAIPNSVYNRFWHLARPTRTSNEPENDAHLHRELQWLFC